MKVERAEKIFKKKNDIDPTLIQRGEREGIEIEKGAVLTQPFLEKNRELFEKYATFFSIYPDLFLDTIRPAESSFELFFYQRIVLRAIMRFKEVYVTACLDGDTPILTEDGMVPIKDFDVNRRVWSKGEWCEVDNLNMRSYSGDMYRITCDTGLERDIYVTENHKLLTPARDDPKKLEWRQAKDLKRNDYLVSFVDDEVREIRDSYGLPLDDMFLEFIGMFLARGICMGDEIKFPFSKGDGDFLFRLDELLTHIIGPTGFIEKDPIVHEDIYCINNKKLLDALNAVFEREDEPLNMDDTLNMGLPPKLLHLESARQLHLLFGWFMGTNGNMRTFSSVLVEGMKMICYRNNINPKVTSTTCNGAKFYKLWLPTNIDTLFLKAGLNRTRCPEINDDARIERDFPIITDQGKCFLHRIAQTKKKKVKNKEVWCLELKNEQFNTCGIEGHNCRAFSKSFLTILAIMLQCIFLPGTKRFICAPNKLQAAQIAKEKILEIYEKYPLLKREIVGGDVAETPGNFGKDYITLRYRNQSIFDVVGALDSQRGGRRHGGLIDEIRKSVSRI